MVGDALVTSAVALGDGERMVEVLKTSDPVRLSFLRAMLQDAGIEVMVFDASAPWPGAIPSRLMVADRQAWLARRLIQDAEPGAAPA